MPMHPFLFFLFLYQLNSGERSHLRRYAANENSVYCISIAEPIVGSDMLASFTVVSPTNVNIASHAHTCAPSPMAILNHFRSK